MGTIIKVRRIGNSKGILFPKSILVKSGIKDEVEIKLKDNVITIVPAQSKKQWSDFKREKREQVDNIHNKFDSTEWTW